MVNPVHESVRPRLLEDETFEDTGDDNEASDVEEENSGEMESIDENDESGDSQIDEETSSPEDKKEDIFDENANISGNIKIANESGGEKIKRTMKKALGPNLGLISVNPVIKKKVPTVPEMVDKAIIELKERSGSSVQSIKKYILNNYDSNITRLYQRIYKYLKKSVDEGKFVQKKMKFQLHPKYKPAKRALTLKKSKKSEGSEKMVQKKQPKDVNEKPSKMKLIEPKKSADPLKGKVLAKLKAASVSKPSNNEESQGKKQEKKKISSKSKATKDKSIIKVPVLKRRTTITTSPKKMAKRGKPKTIESSPLELGPSTSKKAVVKTAVKSVPAISQNTDGQKGAKKKR